MSSPPTGNKLPTYQLYTYHGSSCAARIIIAARLLGIPLSLTHVDLSQGSHLEPSFATVNPSHAVPVLVIHAPPESNKPPIVITQSIAILEYFDEVHAQGAGTTAATTPPRPRLLPPADRPEDRARVRELVGIVASDIFPPTNGRIAKRVRRIRDEVSDQIEWVHEVMAAGFASYETMLQQQQRERGGRYSCGDEVTMADVCLVPAWVMAMGYKLDVTPYPSVKRTYDALLELEAFKKENWALKGDRLE